MRTPRYLLDTCVCVFLMRNKFNIGKKIEEIGVRNCCISEITVAELLFGAVWSGNENNLRLTQGFCRDIEVIPVGNCLMEYATQKAALRREGNIIDDFDLLIGVTALSNGMTLVTDNVKHFERLSKLTVVNWISRSR